MRNILEILTDRPLYFRPIVEEGNIHATSENEYSPVLFFAQGDYIVLQTIRGEKFKFNFEDTATVYPGTDIPAFPSGNQHIICWKTPDGRVGWQNSAPWMKDECSKIEELESADYSTFTLVTILGNHYPTAPWINNDVVNQIMDDFKPHQADYSIDLKIVDNRVVSYYTNYGNDAREVEKRIKLYKRLGKELQ